MSNILRVGIIGAGGIARNVHLPNYSKHNDKVKVVAIADVVRGNAEVLAIEFGIDHVFSDYKEMLETVELDAVSICTPNKFHAAATIAALEAGCHVICEKPPAMTVEEAELMAHTAQKMGKILTYGFNFRHTEEVSALKKYIQADELGEIYAARVHAIRRRGIPGWGVFTNKELQGGGPLIDIGVHMLDTALYLMDYPEPDTVFGVAYQKLGNKKGVGLFGEWDWEKFSVEDMVRGMITFTNGSSIIIETAFAANIQQHEEMSVVLMGDKGGADVFPLKIYQEKHDTLVDVTPTYLPKNRDHPLQMERFIQSCIAGEPPISTPKQGVILQKIINGLYESADKGEAIKLNNPAED
ncbi:Gfo/Idh/MocA family oxidoreductase [Peribacillus psychrosaccharolyticus]|uniref:Gfo/Idh/MocA family oxidoreductase n=1 Tax=Peribacillus psychrosaccharolyticus TaxID=1407 RepID=A0A974NKV8_PERPY|nr:Gfo/Idh/MocA family oxidoreductase [Peribacillus psychrosaccharolyticus]MEC2054457.1 Gfo/Idh/MocA family oxidoreductase [Peribacillus psychrosaccharolyticus]MED3744316.1 Gfo/Idh/MocA family oxidoreductase [Peribacillus psychrosaccharolyticus]QQS99795.1 Gfo/Idh/MocA family oxidoreductase [Peribacillus psychrosaccharolyticus]